MLLFLETYNNAFQIYLICIKLRERWMWLSQGSSLLLRILPEPCPQKGLSLSSIPVFSCCYPQFHKLVSIMEDNLNPLTVFAKRLYHRCLTGFQKRLWQGIVGKVSRWKNLRKSSTLLWKNVRKKIAVLSGGDLEPSRTSTMELFCKNS